MYPPTPERSRERERTLRVFPYCSPVYGAFVKCATVLEYFMSVVAVATHTHSNNNNKNKEL